MTLLLLLGTWPVALFLIAGLIAAINYGVKQSKSGSITGGNYLNPRREWKENVPFHKTMGGVFSFILAAVLITYFIWAVTSK